MYNFDRTKMRLCIPYSQFYLLFQRGRLRERTIRYSLRQFALVKFYVTGAS